MFCNNYFNWLVKISSNWMCELEAKKTFPKSNFTENLQLQSFLMLLLPLVFKKFNKSDFYVQNFCFF